MSDVLIASSIRGTNEWKLESFFYDFTARELLSLQQAKEDSESSMTGLLFIENNSSEEIMVSNPELSIQIKSSDEELGQAKELETIERNQKSINLKPGKNVIIFSTLKQNSWLEEVQDDDELVARFKYETIDTSTKEIVENDKSCAILLKRNIEEENSKVEKRWMENINAWTKNGMEVLQLTELSDTVQNQIKEWNALADENEESSSEESSEESSDQTSSEEESSQSSEQQSSQEEQSTSTESISEQTSDNHYHYIEDEPMEDPSYISSIDDTYNEIGSSEDNFFQEEGESGMETEVTSTDVTVKYKPKLIISNYKLNPEMPKAGDEFKMDLTFYNTNGLKAVRNIKISLNGGEQVETVNGVATGQGSVFSPVNSSNTFYIDEIYAGSTASKEITLKTVPNAAAQNYTMTISFEYEDREGNEYTASEIIGIPVVQQSEVLYGDVVVEEASVGMPVSVDMDFYNTGKDTLSTFMVTVEGDNFELVDSPRYFVGNFTPGATDHFSAQIMPMESGLMKGKVVVTYEDSTGKEHKEEKEFSTEVVEESFQDEWTEVDPNTGEMIDPNTGLPIDPMTGEVVSGTNNMPFIIGGVLLVVIIAALLLRRRNKKKKELEDLHLDD